MSRYRMSRKSSRRSFTRHSGAHFRNRTSAAPRGGIRM